MAQHRVVARFAYQGLISTYVDGVQVSVLKNSLPDPAADWPSVMDSVDTSEPITLGNDVTGAYKIQGGYDIDDVGIWNRALARTEAESIYTAAQAGHSFDVAGAPTILISVALVSGHAVISYSGGTLPCRSLALRAVERGRQRQSAFLFHHPNRSGPILSCSSVAGCVGMFSVSTTAGVGFHSRACRAPEGGGGRKSGLNAFSLTCRHGAL